MWWRDPFELERAADIAKTLQYFKPTELMSNDGRPGVPQPIAMKALDNLRHVLNKPLIINSAYRSPQWNKLVGGAKHSYHVKGLAFDIDTKEWTPNERMCLTHAAGVLGFHGLGMYDTFIHIDMGPHRRWIG